MKAFPQYTEYDYDHRISIVKRTIMCADMSRIEWNKGKNKKANTTQNTSGKGQKAKPSDCNSATSFFNFLTQR